MGFFDPDFDQPELAARFEEAQPWSLIPDEVIVVSDRVEVARRLQAPVVFVGSSLTSFMPVMRNEYVRGVLLPRDVSRDTLAAVAKGDTVFSRCEAEDLELKPLAHRLVSLLAHGHTIESIAAEIGYSERQVRRIAGGLRRTARLESGYPWPLLTPLFRQ